MTDRTETTNPMSADEELALATPVTQKPEDDALLSESTEFETSDDAVSPNLHTGTGSTGEATSADGDGAGSGYTASGYEGDGSTQAATSSTEDAGGEDIVTAERDDVYAGDSDEDASGAGDAADASGSTGSDDAIDAGAGSTDASEPISARSFDTFSVNEPAPQPEPEAPVDETEPEPQPEEPVDEVEPAPEEPVDEVQPEPEPEPEAPVDEVVEPEPQPEEPVDEVEPEPEPAPEEPVDEEDPAPEEPVDEVDPEPETEPEAPVDEVVEPEEPVEEPVDEVEPEPQPEPEEPVSEEEPAPEEPVDEVDPEPETEPEEPVDEVVEPEPEPQPEEPVDDGNNGHGNDEDGVDESNPGQGGGGPTGENNETPTEEPVSEEDPAPEEPVDEVDPAPETEPETLVDEVVEPEPEPQPEEPVDEVTPPAPAEPRDLGTVTADNANSVPGIKVYTVNLHNEVGTVDKVDGGMGVDEPDDRIGQIEYDPKTGNSEQLVIELDQDATEMTWSVDRLYQNEDRDGYHGTDETGRYELYNDGVKVGEGQFVANSGSDNGTYTISHSGGFDKVVFSATDFTNGAQSGEDANHDGLADDGSYNNVDKDGKTITTGSSRTDSTDYVVTSVNFKTTLEADPQPQEPAGEETPAAPADPEPEQPVEDVIPEDPTGEEETPAEEQPAEEQPVDEQPAEEEPAEEETPVDEAPAEEQPAEEDPVEEPAGEETPDTGAVVAPEPEPEAPAEPQPVTVKLTFMGEDAGYHSSVGVYRVGQDGNISDVQIVFRDASNGASGMQAGETSATFGNYADGDKVGVFIVADGWNQNGGYSSLPSGGSYSFVNSAGEPASANDPSVKLVYTAPSGQTYNIKGDVFHAGNDAADLNPDNINHTQATTSDDGSATSLNFEDLYGGGDNDFNDMTLKVEVKGGSVSVGDGEITDPDSVVDEQPAAPAEEPVAPVEDTNPEEPVTDPDVVDDGAANAEEPADDDQPADEQPAEDPVVEEPAADEQPAEEPVDETPVETPAEETPVDETPAEEPASDATVIQGTDNQDMLVGGNDAEEIHGAGGGDMVVGGGGDDTIYGEDGADNLNGDAGDDVIVGGEGADMLNGGDGSDVLFAGDGDYVSGGTGDGWVDTLDVSHIEGAGGSADWTLNLTSGSVVEQGEDYVTLTQDASGHLTTADGSEIEFEGIERING